MRRKEGSSVPAEGGAREDGRSGGGDGGRISGLFFLAFYFVVTFSLLLPQDCYLHHVITRLRSRSSGWRPRSTHGPSILTLKRATWEEQIFLQESYLTG